MINKTTELREECWLRNPTNYNQADENLTPVFIIFGLPMIPMPPSHLQPKCICKREVALGVQDLGGMASSCGLIFVFWVFFSNLTKAYKGNFKSWFFEIDY